MPSNRAIRVSRSPGHRARRERGTILVLALAVLAILGVAAVSYVTVVRTDRESTTAISREVNYQQQVDRLVEYIGQLIAADLHGNKLVTTSVPKSLNGNVRVWPSLFEDGESWDYPMIDDAWLDPSVTPESPLVLDPAAQASADRIARPDDSWLADVEPLWDENNPNLTSTWGQITNLRSAYVWKPADLRWERMDGRFVDLRQWFTRAQNGRGNPCVDLLAAGSAVDDQPLTAGDHGTAFLDDGTLNPIEGTAVFDRQISELGRDVNPGDQVGVLTQSDTAQWADCDGDLRPDSRWTVLEALGDLYGLKWVAAARIIDLSALVNVRSAIEFPYEATGPTAPGGGDMTKVLGDGGTPADVDLYRLLAGAADMTGGLYDETIEVRNLTRPASTFEDHLREGLGFRAAMAQLADNASYPYDPSVNFIEDPAQATRTWQPNVDPLTRAQRAAWTRWVGARLTDTDIEAVIGYPQRDLIDLQAFWGTNHSSVTSKFEQRIDGPGGDGGYLIGSMQTGYGPLRAKEQGSDARRFEQLSGANAEPQPTPLRLKRDVRRLLTTVSGAGKFAPVPVTNTAPSFAGQYLVEKVNIPDVARVAAGVDGVPDGVAQDIFSMWMYALAPAALLSRSPTGAGPVPALPGLGLDPSIASDTTMHYGGREFGRADQTAAEPPFNLNAGGAGAAYALHRAGALTVNLIDAVDERMPGNQVQNEVPTVARLRLEVEEKTNVATESLHLRTPQGDISVNALPTAMVPTDGITFVGVDRQPFLVELHTYAVYQDQRVINAMDGETAELRVINPDNPDEQVGAIIAFELANPWSNTIDLTGYRVSIGDDGTFIQFDLGQIQDTSENPVIAPGSTRIFYYATGLAEGVDVNDSTPTPGRRTEVWAELKAEWVDDVPDAVELRNNGFDDRAEKHQGLPSVLQTEPLTRVLFQDLVSRSEASVMLIYDGGIVSSVESAVLVDRMRAGQVGDRQHVVGGIDGAGVKPTYEVIPGSENDPTVVEGGLRVAVQQNIWRATERSNSLPGFPPYVLEEPELNGRASTWDGGTGTNSPVTEPTTFREVWTYPAFPDVPLPSDVAGSLFDVTDATITLGDPKGEFGDGSGIDGIGLGSFQLFVPNRSLRDPSELLMLCAHAHMYFHPDDNNPIATRNDRWITATEQLARRTNFIEDDPFASVGMFNPYFGVLDPSSIPPGLLTLAELPTGLAVPPPVRAVDLFETLDTQDFLVQGRININTAPPEVLDVVPGLSPQFDIGVVGSGGVVQEPMGGQRRVAIEQYRSRELDPEQWLGILGLRDTDDELPRVRGLTTPGELVVMDSRFGPTWDNRELFLSVGIDGQSASFPLETYVDLPAEDNAYADADFNPIDDAEERLALYRMLSNIVTTRSDVFLAWFIVRGYDPADIEAVALPNNPSLSQVHFAMDDPENNFGPTYESRWLAVYDRSTVKRPSDRPRLIMLVELPVAGG